MKNLIPVINSFIAPKETQKHCPSGEEAAKTPHILINKCNFGNNGFIIIVSLLALCYITANSVLSLKHNTPAQNVHVTQESNRPFDGLTVEFTREERLINAHEADNIKSLVRLVSQRENKHPNSVHNELKRLYGYYRYREIDHVTYQKVVQNLQARCGD